MMGSIEIENMEFYAYHGHYEEEQIVGNRFQVTVCIETNLEKPAKSDNLEDALNYQKVYRLIKDRMEVKSHLLENIAQGLIDAIYSNFKDIQKVRVKVSKMNPPMGGKIEKVSVILEK